MGSVVLLLYLRCCSADADDVVRRRNRRVTLLDSEVGRHIGYQLKLIIVSLLDNIALSNKRQKELLYIHFFQYLSACFSCYSQISYIEK